MRGNEGVYLISSAKMYLMPAILKEKKFWIEEVFHILKLI